MTEMNDGRDVSMLLEKKHAIFQTYLSISRKLKNVLGEGKEKALRKLLSERRYCIKQIQNIDGAIGEIIGSVGDLMSRVPEKGKTQARRLLDNIRALMETIAPLDREVMVIVKSESNTLQAELLKIRHSRMATKGYGNKTAGPPRFFHLRS